MSSIPCCWSKLSFTNVLLIMLTLLFGSTLFAEYSVVIRSSGKIVKGELVQESEELIVLRTDGINVQFKKNLLDLEKMKTLNQISPKKEPLQMQEKTITNGAARQKKDQQIPLAELAKKVNQERTGNAKLLKEGDQPCASGSEFSEGPDPHSVDDAKYYEEEIANLEYQYQQAGQTIDPNDKRLVSLQNKLARARQEVEGGESVKELHEQQEKAHNLQGWIRDEERWLQEARDRGDLKMVKSHENDIAMWKKQLEETDTKIQNMQREKQPCNPLQLKPQQPKTQATVLQPVKPVEAKKSNTRVFTEADIKPHEEETPEEYNDLTSEQKAAMIEKIKKDIEWLETQINAIKKNGGAQILIDEKEKELKEDQKKLRFLTQ